MNQALPLVLFLNGLGFSPGVNGTNDWEENPDELFLQVSPVVVAQEGRSIL